MRSNVIHSIDMSPAVARASSQTFRVTSVGVETGNSISIMLHHCSWVTGLISPMVRRHAGDRSKVFDMVWSSKNI